ncbi:MULTISPECIES: NAD-dependent epimerase/dehydratase family protein [unclassified Imperialibacter]|uniref:NAD-dependent epimerase/dehydratase family protein n=1 Tax=unclassified Imperialibacter TaxID=2629706 RepID=UPI001251257E|nr:MULTISPECIES: NAD-dependent epimerase/dehydratase family protein [unclassified Imperialibacter]CAD5252867.1 putative UDP-glucose 4-epimerase [Imperialibacter sp. 89]CAD5261030.1 putative UDP-glucose 4-epimerase [Imperialibacter sp. 75]VVT03757.1 putative UDP-glucose 4-epimerase [Imperialibacter sp. EC-SDR9]
MSTKSKVLVTGGAGFIGSHVVDQLMSEGNYEVMVMDNLVTGRPNNLMHHGEAVILINADISDSSSWQTLNFTPDYIIHLAAQVSVPASFGDPAYCHRVNVSGFLNMLDFARVSKVKKVVYASSSAIYGDQGERRISESDAPNPLSPYGASKLLNEWYAGKYHEWFGVSAIGLRFFNVYGPRQLNDSPYSGVIAKFKHLIQNEQPVTIFGDGKQTRDFVYVTEVAKAIELAMLSPASLNVFNVGTGEPCDLTHLAEIFSSVFGRELVLQYQPAREGDIRHSLADVGKLKTELGFQSTIDLKAGVRLLTSTEEEK